jgi:tetratricopeptide (TPR) repeat protein
MIRFAQEEYDESLKHHRKSLKLNEKVSNMFELSTSYNNIGVVYEEKKEYGAALREYLKGLEIAQKSNSTSYICLIASNVAGIYQETHELDKIEKYVAITLENAEKAGDLYFKGKGIFLQGDIYRQRDEWESASEKYNEAIDLLRTINKPSQLVNYLIGAAGHFQEFGDSEQAREFYNEALGIYQKLGNKNKIGELTKKLNEF